MVSFSIKAIDSYQDNRLDLSVILLILFELVSSGVHVYHCVTANETIRDPVDQVKSKSCDYLFMKSAHRLCNSKRG